MILTEEVFEEGKSSNGAWSRRQLQLLGVKWPLRSGWRKHIINQEYPDPVIQRFLKLKDAHLPTRGRWDSDKKDYDTRPSLSELTRAAIDALRTLLRRLEEEGL